jgi:N-acetylglucosaminyldiphosphoundecaprenol N-acetyl-beta-D-mannosaminyltransferase
MIKHDLVVRRLFNIPFCCDPYEKISPLFKDKKFIVVPSGPGLSEIDTNPKYYDALQNADFALPDSGLMVLLLKFISINIKKLSGPKFFRELVQENTLKREHSIFTIDPSDMLSENNRRYLNSIEIPITSAYQYVAPMYEVSDIVDPELISVLEALPIPPDFILINLGGGIQERLGFYIKNKYSKSVNIICTGAAISIINGDQTNIKYWVDKYHLGWFKRIISSPNPYFIRYVKAVRFIWIFFKYHRTPEARIPSKVPGYSSKKRKC